MILLFALAAAASTPSLESLAPAQVRVTTSFSCAGTARAITILRTPTRDTVESILTNGRRSTPAQLAQIRSALAPLDQIDAAEPLCAQGPHRILIRGHSGSRKKTMMIFFGPKGEVAAREVG